MDNSNGYRGALNPNNTSSEFNERDFHTRQILAMSAFGTLCRVVKVTNNGGLSPVGLIDVIPMVLQRDGFGNPVDNNVIHDVPYMRIQGGTRAVIIDPAVGDIGYVAFADKDISKVKATRADALPGSERRNDHADGVWLGGVLNGAPTSFLRMQGDDIYMQCPGNFAIQAGGQFSVTAADVSLTATDGSAEMTGNLNVNGEVSANSIPLTTHKHTGIQPGSGTSGGPTP